MPKTLTFKVLADNGDVWPGLVIEVVPMARLRSGNERIFRGRFGNISRREVIWEHDDKTYSLTSLTDKLKSRGFVRFLNGHTYETWRIKGKRESLWQMAERRGR